MSPELSKAECVNGLRRLFLFIRGGVICSVFFWLPIRQGGAGNVFIRRTGTAGARFPRSVTFGASPQGAKKWKAVCVAALKSEKREAGIASCLSDCQKTAREIRRGEREIAKHPQKNAAGGLLRHTKRRVSPASIFDNLAIAHPPRRLSGVSSFRLMERAFQFAP